LIKIPV